MAKDVATATGNFMDLVMSNLQKTDADKKREEISNFMRDVDFNTSQELRRLEFDLETETTAANNTTSLVDTLAKTVTLYSADKNIAGFRDMYSKKSQELTNSANKVAAIEKSIAELKAFRATLGLS